MVTIDFSHSLTFSLQNHSHNIAWTAALYNTNPVLFSWMNSKMYGNVCVTCDDQEHRQNTTGGTHTQNVLSYKSIYTRVRMQLLVQTTLNMHTRYWTMTHWKIECKLSMLSGLRCKTRITFAHTQITHFRLKCKRTSKMIRIYNVRTLSSRECFGHCTVWIHEWSERSYGIRM